MVEIDIPARKINVLVSEEELDKRMKEELARGKAAFTPKTRKRVLSKALRAYASMVSSADLGAIRLID
jgi:dihydroxy-acid dehydratase